MVELEDNKDKGDFLQKVPCTHPVLSAPTHASARDSWIKDLLNMALPVRTRPSFPFSQSPPSGNFHEPLILNHQGADRLKTAITENNQTDHMDHSLVLLNETMSHAV